jgi:quinohemoprotein amine dehydrogenase beta subunit
MKRSGTMPRALVGAGLKLLTALAFLACHPALASDLIVTGAKPDRLFVIDAAARSVRSEYRIPDARGAVYTLVVSPDQKVAYVLVGGMERIVGIDLATGKAVFRAELSSAEERVKSFFALALTPDGRELIVHEVPTRLLPSEYVVEEPRFAVFRTDAGLNAKPVRTFPAPRRVHMLLMRPGGKSFYAIGFDLFEYETRTGKLVGTRGIQNWGLGDHTQPDLLAVWPVTEPTGIWTSPIYSEVKKTGGNQAVTGLMSLDLKSGDLAYADFEPLSALIFSTVLAPAGDFAYGVYSTLSKIDVKGHRLAKRVPLDHTFYAVNMSPDGRELYLGGTTCDVGFYDAATLEKKTVLKLPDCGDQSLSTLRVIQSR